MFTGDWESERGVGDEVGEGGSEDYHCTAYQGDEKLSKQKHNHQKHERGKPEKPG